MRQALWPLMSSLLFIFNFGCGEPVRKFKNLEVSIQFPSTFKSECHQNLSNYMGEDSTVCLVLSINGHKNSNSYKLDYKNSGLSFNSKADIYIDADGKTLKPSLFFMSSEYDCSELDIDQECTNDYSCIVKFSGEEQDLFSKTEIDFCKKGESDECFVSWSSNKLEEVFDCFDNDCDGIVDEDAIPDLCVDGIGACKAFNPYVCNSRNELVCSTENPVGEPTEEKCDGVDNDCDGRVDNTPDHQCCTEDITEPCGTSNGICSTGTRVRRCINFEYEDSECLDETGTPVETGREEICNGEDDDCDGFIDNGLKVYCETDVDCPDNFGTCTEENYCSVTSDRSARPGMECKYSNLMCDNTGSFVCNTDNNSYIICDADPIILGAEICDGIDNDCSGGIDEPWSEGGSAVSEENLALGSICMAGIGACAREGVQVCDPNDPSKTSCEADLGMPDVEICNNIDDDCDGVIDNGFNVGQNCESGVGECLTTGQTACSPEGELICSVSDENLIHPVDEICDGKDNDCNGEIDNGFNLESDPQNCGRCGAACDIPNSVVSCENSSCVFVECMNGFVDFDENLENGCECESGGDDSPDENFFDSNCDGIDGNLRGPIFVSQNFGDDVRGLGEYDTPVATLARAIEFAILTENYDIYLDAGTYDVTDNARPEDFSENYGLRIPNRINIFGGFSYSSGVDESGEEFHRWARDHFDVYPSIITGNPVTLNYQSLTEETKLENVIIIATQAAEGSSSIGLYLRDVGPHLKLTGVRVQTSKGGAGLDGIDGADGHNGVDGGDGRGGDEAEDPSLGGDAGSHGLCPGVIAGRGGNGSLAAEPAADGENADLFTPAESGVGGTAGDLSQAALPNPGLDGLAGAHGANVTAPSIYGKIDSNTFLWVPRAGGRAEAGGEGRGGGGGGGGASPIDANGGGGGGGGSGACGGSGAHSSIGGYGSFGIYLLGGQITLKDVQIIVGDGGDGGRGGRGGRGGLGGQGGLGGLVRQQGCPTCQEGAVGGRGGDGGCGGHTPGGAGGPSFGIFRISTSGSFFDILESDVIVLGEDGEAIPADQIDWGAFIQLGSAGTPGAGASVDGCGPASEDGAAGQAGFIGCCRGGAPRSDCIDLSSCEPNPGAG